MNEHELSVKEWMEEAGFDPSHWMYYPIKTVGGFPYPLCNIMLRFANNKSMMLEGRLFDWRNGLSPKEKEKFDTHFGIKTVTLGKIDNNE